jgi:hypothetical protein
VVRRGRRRAARAANASDRPSAEEQGRDTAVGKAVGGIDDDAVELSPDHPPGGVVAIRAARVPPGRTAIFGDSLQTRTAGLDAAAAGALDPSDRTATARAARGALGVTDLEIGELVDPRPDAAVARASRRSANTSIAARTLTLGKS